MNGSEQRQHRTVTATLAQGVESIASESSARFERIELLLKAHRDQWLAAVNAERTHRLDLAKEQRSYVDNENRMLRLTQTALCEDFRALRHRGFWSRLNWLLTGR